jgi:hypothetical protein
VTKRSHIRIPVAASLTSFDSLLPIIDETIRPQVLDVIVRYKGPLRQPWSLEFLLNTLCVLLYQIKAIMDDRRVLR